jgi:hypothetical protein
VFKKPAITLAHLEDFMKNTPSASATLVPLRRRLTSALLVLGLTLGTMAMTASPVDAASVVITCFQRQGPSPSVVAGFTVQLWASNGVFFEQIGLSQETDHAGCTRFDVPPGHQGKFLYTQVKHVTERFYTGYSYAAYFHSPPDNWYPMTIFGDEYAPYAPYAWPGDHVWFLFGVFQCQQSWPVPNTPC